jgi:hypothetical protein
MIFSRVSTRTGFHMALDFTSSRWPIPSNGKYNTVSLLLLLLSFFSSHTADTPSSVLSELNVYDIDGVLSHQRVLCNIRGCVGNIEHYMGTLRRMSIDSIRLERMPPDIIASIEIIAWFDLYVHVMLPLTSRDMMMMMFMDRIVVQDRGVIPHGNLSNDIYIYIYISIDIDRHVTWYRMQIEIRWLFVLSRCYFFSHGHRIMIMIIFIIIIIIFIIINNHNNDNDNFGVASIGTDIDIYL